MEDHAFGRQLYLGKKAHTASADGDRAGAGVTSYTVPLPSGGAAAIATCTALEQDACCLFAFEDAEMKQGQGEWRLMVQIGCRCPPHKQDLFLQHVHGAREVAAEWRQQLLMAVGEGLAEEEEERRGGASISLTPPPATTKLVP
jgi:hypothetical protein